MIIATSGIGRCLRNPTFSRFVQYCRAVKMFCLNSEPNRSTTNIKFRLSDAAMRRKKPQISSKFERKLFHFVINCELADH